MNGRVATWVMSVVLVLALGGQVLRAHRQLWVSHTTWQAKQRLVSVMTGEQPIDSLPSAVSALRKAIRLAPNRVGPVATLGDVYHVLGRLDAAAQTYDQAIILEPRPELYLNGGLVALRLDQNERGESLVRRAILLDPELRDAIPPRLLADETDTELVTGAPLDPGNRLFSAGFEAGDCLEWSSVVEPRN